MHIDSQWKDHGLLTQLHGSFHPFNIKIENSKTNFYSRSKTNFHSRSKTNEGKEKFLNPKRCGGEGQNDPLGMDKACMSSIFVKTSQIFFW